MATTTKKKPKKKRVWTKAMREAFARRMKRARNKKKTTGKKKTVKRKKVTAKKKSAPKRTVKRKRTLKKGAPPMASRKKRKSSAKSSKRRRKSYGGKRQVVNSLRDASIAVAGDIAAGMVANALPIPNATLKAASPIAIGAVLLMTLGKKNSLVRQMSTGMMVLGGVAAIRAQFPSVPLLAGEEEIIVDADDLMGLDDDDYEVLGLDDDDYDLMGLDDDDYEVLGLDDDDYDLMGGPVELAGPVDLVGADRFRTTGNM